jgi:hypothetical protein
MTTKKKQNAAKKPAAPNGAASALGKTQRAVLAALAKAKDGKLTRAELTERAGGFIGSSTGNVSAKIGAQHPHSLQARGYITLDTPKDGPTMFTITAAGRKALASAK